MAKKEGWFELALKATGIIPTRPDYTGTAKPASGGGSKIEIYKTK